MDYKTKRIIIWSVFAVASLVVAYMTYSLIAYGSPLNKTMRQHLKEGNELYADSLYSQALKPYSKALDIDENNLVACYNAAANIISNNLNQKEDMDIDRVVSDYLYADTLLMRVIKNDSVKKNIVNSWHNKGVIYHKVARNDSLNYTMNKKLASRDSLSQVNYNDSVPNLLRARDAYREALRIDPGNDETRYNLAIVQKLLEKDNNGGGGGASNNENQEQQNNQDNQDQQNKQDQQDKQNKQDQQDKQNQQDKQDQQDEQNKQNQQDRLLNAIKDKEKKTREKMNQPPVNSGRKNLEKNW